MPAEIVFLALENIRQVSYLPRDQISALIERIDALYKTIKILHPNAICICSWHEDSLSGLDENCSRIGISLDDKIFLKDNLTRLAHHYEDLYLLANATVDRKIKSPKDLQKIRELYTLHYNVRDDEKAINCESLYLEHEKDCLELVKRGYSPDQKKRVISGFFYHSDDYKRHDKCYPWKESYNPLIIWQPPKQEYTNPFIQIEDSEKKINLSCQLAFCRELSFAKGKTDILIVMSNTITVRENHAHLSDVIFQADSHCSALYLTPTFCDQFVIHAYRNNVSEEALKLSDLKPQDLKNSKEENIKSIRL